MSIVVMVRIIISGFCINVLYKYSILTQVALAAALMAVAIAQELPPDPYPCHICPLKYEPQKYGYAAPTRLPAQRLRKKRFTVGAPVYPPSSPLNLSERRDLLVGRPRSPPPSTFTSQRHTSQHQHRSLSY